MAKRFWGFRARLALALLGALALGLAAGTALAGTLPPGVIALYDDAIAQFNRGRDAPPGERTILNTTAGGLSLQTQAVKGSFVEVKRELNELEVKGDRLLDRQYPEYSSPLPGGSNAHIFVACPDGYEVLNGGWESNAFAATIAVFANGPQPGGVGWQVGLVNTGAVTINVSVLAICTRQ